MAVYGKRRYYAKKRKYAKKRYVKKVKTSVGALARKVNALTKKVATNTAPVYMWSARAEDTPISQPYSYWNLLPLSSMAGCFGTNATDFAESNKIFIKKIKLDMTLNASIEKDNIDYTCMILSLRDQANNGVRWDPATANLTLSAPIDYTTLGTAGTRVNPKLFKIHYYRRFFTSNAGATWSSTGVGDVKSYYKRITKTLNCNLHIQNPAGNWNAIPCPNDPSKNLYLVLFNNDFTLDGESARVSLMTNYTAIVSK